MSQASAGFLLLTEEIDFISAAFNLKIDSTYTNDMPTDVISKVTDAAAALMRIAEQVIQFVKKRLEFMIGQICTLLDAVLSEGAVKQTESVNAAWR